CSVRITTPSGLLDILTVDLPSSPLSDRRGMLAAVANWVGSHDRGVPLLIAGDFNTPADSLAFQPLRRLARRAYETVGHGWPYSWPVPMPLWSLDHIWYTHAVQARNHEYRFALCSDHLREVFDFELPGPTTQQAGASE